MPMGQFKDWDACISHYTNKGESKESASRICGSIKNKVETKSKAIKWIESIFKKDKNMT